MKEKDLFERIFLSNVMSKNSSLMFTVEQWELTRRLRLTGLTKEQVCQAFDDLDKMEKDLSCLFTTLSPHSALSTNTPTNNSHHNELVLKNFQLLMAKNLANINQQQQQQQQQQQHQTSNSDNYNNSIQSTNAAFMIVHNHFLKVNDPDTENKEIDDFKSKGEVAIHSEISFFVYKHDLKQSQISRMAGVNQAYVSKFLRGEFFELSENGKTLIYKWYLRFLKNPTIFRKQ
jgi:predicted XRE-type DNA-binding protein